MLDLDDLSRLLFEGDARGENSLDGWELRVAPGTDPRVARMVSLHETFHGQLNDSSAMGTLLHGLAWVVRNRPDAPHLEALLRGLVGRCRNVHETYATWLSLLVVGQGQPATELLAGNALYSSWFRRGEQLAGELRGGYLRYHAVSAGLRACMQGEEIRTVLDRGLDQVRLADLPAARAPDALFRHLLHHRPWGLWSEALRHARAARPELPGWDLIAASQEQPDLYYEAMAAELDETSSWLMTCFHDAAASVLPPTAGVTDFNGHLPYVEPLIHAAQALLPPGPVRVPLRAAAPGETPEAEIIAAFKGERLVLREPPLTAGIVAPIDQVEPEHLVAGTGPHAHLFLWAAANRRWRKQHRWPLGGPADDDEPLTALRKVVAAGEQRELQVFPCPGSAELARAHQALGGSMPVVACVSMAVYGNESWSRQWLPALREATLLAVLVDLDPFHHLELRSRGDGPAFSHAQLDLPEDQVPNRVFVLKPNGLAHLFLIPCMPLLASSLLHFIRHVVPQPGRFRADSSFLEAADHIALGVLLGHLLGEERIFNFSAGRILRKEEA